jgi:hypothetical protein
LRRRWKITNIQVAMSGEGEGYYLDKWGVRVSTKPCGPGKRPDLYTCVVPALTASLRVSVNVDAVKGHMSHTDFSRKAVDNLPKAVNKNAQWLSSAKPKKTPPAQDEEPVPLIKTADELILPRSQELAVNRLVVKVEERKIDEWHAQDLARLNAVAS